jgi:hypothetical protein
MACREKYQRLRLRKEGEPNPFVDRAGYLAHIDLQEGNFQKMLKEQTAAVRGNVAYSPRPDGDDHASRSSRRHRRPVVSWRDAASQGWLAQVAGCPGPAAAAANRSIWARGARARRCPSFSRR